MLVDERPAHDAASFTDLREDRTVYPDLSAAEASSYIEELINTDKILSELATSDLSGAEEKRHTPGPATERQSDLLRKLGEENAIGIRDRIDAKRLYSRLTASAASHLIEDIAVRFPY